jgi:thymidylate kinase
MDTQLIMLAGSSPGAGKSTISEYLHEQFARNGVATRCIYEEVVLTLNVFAPVVKAFENASGDPVTALLAAAQQTVDELRASGDMQIMDALFPGFTWLYAADVPEVRITEYSRTLASIFSSLRPVIVYLDSPVVDSLQRAGEQRGQVWLTELIDAVQSYEIAKKHPVHTLDNVAEFFESVRSLALRLLAEWPHNVIKIDTAATGLDQIKHDLLQQFDLTERKLPAKSSVAELHAFVGVYQTSDSQGQPKQLVVRFVDDALHVNAQWPNGCPLVQETAMRFRLKSTSWIIEFDSQFALAPRRLASSVGGRTLVYDRLET